MTLTQRDRRFLARDDEPDALQIVRARGARVIDAHRRSYIDFTSGGCVGNLGWGEQEIRRAVRRFDGPTYVSPSWLYAPWVELAELLARIAPGKLTKSFRATGGSEAVELALQAAMAHTGRGKFLSLEDSYHGNTLGALSIGASETRETLPNLLSRCVKVKPPLDTRALATIERQLRRRDVAAFIMEPISIAHGVLVPDPASVAELQRQCRRYGTLLIMDEVASGFGRTGKIFATEHFPIEPDMLCLAKALTAGYGAMGALLTTKEVADSMEEDGNFYSTFGWHPLSVAAAIAAVRFLVRNEKRLLANVETMSRFFAARLAAMQLPSLRALRVQGLAIALEFESEIVPRLQKKCLARGLLIADSGDSTALLLPPLNIDRRTAAAGLDILAACAGKP